MWGSAGDIELYNQYIGRFVSEYGMQGMIPMSSIRNFATNLDMFLVSPVMNIHERHIAGWPNLHRYMNDYFKPTKDFETFVYGTMVMQAYAVEVAI